MGTVIGLIGCIILLAISVCGLVFNWPMPFARKPAPQAPKRAMSMIGWQFQTMLNCVWSVRVWKGMDPITDYEIAFIKMEARSIRVKIGVSELIDPSKQTESLVIAATLSWCAGYLRLHGAMK